MSHCRLASLAATLLALASPAAAHHRQTPPVQAFTTSGDTELPRVAAPGTKTLTLAVQSGANRQILSISPFKKGGTIPFTIAATGDNQNPAVSTTGKAFTWDTDTDPLNLGLPGRQIVLHLSGNILPVSTDPTGTSVNPSLDTVGVRIAFESTGDLANTGNSGDRQVFLRLPDGSMQQKSMGVGTSRNPVVGRKKGVLVWESSSHPVTGADTGVFQIWLGSTLGPGSTAITSGLGSSTNAAVSDDGRIIAFQSTADLAGSGADTGVNQIFTYDTKSRSYARVTNDAGGCTLPAVNKVKRDWRVAFVCGGLPYYYMLRDDQRFLVQTGGGVTQRVIGELGIHFLLLSTTADLVSGGTTAGKQVYMINLFKRPAQAVPGAAVWFPFRGIPAL